jgi:hypothetical protein
MDSSLEAQLLDAAAKSDLAEVERALAEGGCFFCMHTQAASDAQVLIVVLQSANA